VNFLEQSENARVGIVAQCRNRLGVGAEQKLNIACGAIPTPYPDHFGRETEKQAHLAEVRVFGYDDEIVLTRVIPNRPVQRFVQSNSGYVQSVWENIDQLLWQARG